MRVTAEPPDAYFFTSEILGPFNLRLTEHAVSQDVFYTTDKNQVRESLNVCANIADCARNTDFRVAI